MQFHRERLSEFIELIEGDSLDVLPLLEKGSFQAVITDPPYGIAYQSSHRNTLPRFDVIEGDESPKVDWFAPVKPLLVDTGCLLCFCEWKHSEEFRTAMIAAGFHVGAQLVWDRVVPGMGDPSSRPSPAHDLIWFAVHGRYKLPAARPSSVYRVQRLGGHELVHPTQKPVPLMRRLIRDYTPEGARILSPFAGSGTDGIAAAMEGRHCLLIEKDAKYCTVIRERVKRFECQQPGSLLRLPTEADLFAEAIA